MTLIGILFAHYLSEYFPFKVKNYGADVQLASLSSDNVISRQLVNVLDTLHLHTSLHITALSHITVHCHALPHRHSHRTHRTLTDAHIQKHTGYLELPLNYIEPTSS